MTDAFDVCGPLPTGVTVLEASAGTGKTFTIAALAARYVAEGIPLEQILMVTFTRMATGELRERVRERLVSAEHGLERALAGAPPRGRRGRARCSPPARRTRSGMRRERLARGARRLRLRDHRHHPRLLPGGARRPRRARRRRVRHHVRRGHQRPARRGRRRPLRPPLRAAAARRSSAAPRRWRSRGRRSTTRPPRSSRPTRPTTRSPRCACGWPSAAREELEARKRRTGVMTYDDLLTRLSDTLDGRERRGRRGAAARPLPRRARRRVPGHRPRAVADHADGVRRRRDDARADRRPEAGDLRVPRRRRLRLPRGRPRRPARRPR